ncbi:hypothetical protein F383_08370 [Gossypium arboreum]|uniref:Uncharacterized protein n=1 Tax=Gossypium arboreum TaxID=29729 RepID=A0A0B0NU12_GOSAR|nr:hypothetical protein F383_14870 [Gossypium arboreum]KHG15059.1 hypothetical protein F383_18603 [Gossypium arboreum]KHG16147.1 hypothetical protein F383_08370 [Gossypium arboreum]
MLPPTISNPELT